MRLHHLPFTLMLFFTGAPRCGQGKRGAPRCVTSRLEFTAGEASHLFVPLACLWYRLVCGRYSFLHRRWLRGVRDWDEAPAYLCSSKFLHRTCLGTSQGPISSTEHCRLVEPKGGPDTLPGTWPGPTDEPGRPDPCCAFQSRPVPCSGYLASHQCILLSGPLFQGWLFLLACIWPVIAIPANHEQTANDGGAMRARPSVARARR